MSGERRGKMGVAAWSILAVSVPLLYLLSAPPIFIKARIKGGTQGESDWSAAYSQPYYWVRSHTPLQKTLDRYEDWCWEWLIPR